MKQLLSRGALALLAACIAGEDEVSTERSNSALEECGEGSWEEQACSGCTTAYRVCEGGAWGEWSPCFFTGACWPGWTEWVSCGSCGAYQMTCSSECQWDASGQCGPECFP